MTNISGNLNQITPGGQVTGAEAPVTKSFSQSAKEVVNSVMGKLARSNTDSIGKRSPTYQLDQLNGANVKNNLMDDLGMIKAYDKNQMQANQVQMNAVQGELDNLLIDVADGKISPDEADKKQTKIEESLGKKVFKNMLKSPAFKKAIFKTMVSVNHHLAEKGKLKKFDEIKGIGNQDQQVCLGFIPDNKTMKELGGEGLTNDGKKLIILSLVENFEMEGSPIHDTKELRKFANANDEKIEGKGNYKRIETPDYTPMTLSKLEEGADFIHAQLKKEGNEKCLIYVHCKSGKGRSAAIIAAYMVKYQGKTPDQAWAAVKESRNAISADSQIPIVQQLADKIRLEGGVKGESEVSGAGGLSRAGGATQQWVRASTQNKENIDSNS